ncbi:hypothetical protein H310_14954 [Aphanomyces invadans]|uniref:Myb-like domain-containing protein n=1 Tax=Aphanomyces invadans TaxID=157072 RepID=A0A024T827_9STRA|nr:hypothetical protein H310_14954 [Aphanomyces invadans]ETV90210.1 hypothetical protein H310_14954 [Aphanomyces invadans]RHY24536.1 hypothetical protein DYB32_008809 [Aphanomyces invadans]|eukprot:XP_008881156.1 hypothetical protein H310_14954 [Aphanomyces invadans]
MSTQTKRRNFTEQEDIMLLRQVSLEMPFQTRHGQVMERWAAVASALQGSGEFTRDDIDAKRACNRFMLLLDGHRRINKESQRASGVSEEVGEKTILLDDLMVAYDDTKVVEAQLADETREAADHAEAMGSFIRAEAMKSMGPRQIVVLV